MSDAIRCGQCRWWRRVSLKGCCELNPPVWTDADHTTGEESGWYQPFTDGMKIGCSRGEPKASNLTVSDSDPVAMVDGLPVFRAKLTEGQP